MKNTIKITDHGHTKMVAHRGVSGLETENTNAAFVAAGNRSYFGVETDVHKTRDGKYIIIHDDWTGRVGIDQMHVEETTYDTLRGLLLCQTDGVKGRTDIRMPALSEYITICRDYGKTCVLELKNAFTKEEIAEIVAIIKDLGYLDGVIFISFCLENLIALREMLPAQPIQWLTGSADDGVIEKLLTYHLGLDVAYPALTEERVQTLHGKGIEINCWTVDNLQDAQRLIGWGVDYITSNILE